MSFQSRLFLRIISKAREAYLLKVVTLSVAFACTILIILFSLNEFGYDRFHGDHKAIFRLLEKNNDEAYSGNRLSNRIPPQVVSALKSVSSDSIQVSRVKLLKGLNISSGGNTFRQQKIYACDHEMAGTFPFEIIHGALNDFQRGTRVALLSASKALEYFGTVQAGGRTLRLCTQGDTISLSVAAVYRDFPRNSHEDFNAIMSFDSASVRSLRFDPTDVSIYGIRKNDWQEGKFLSQLKVQENRIYQFQRLTDVYFGPRVLGEESSHGDRYSMFILMSITILIVFLATTSYVNLATLTLPHRSKELAVKKLVGTNQRGIIFQFAKESFLVVGISLTLGVLLLVMTSSWINSVLHLDLIGILAEDVRLLVIAVLVPFVLVALAPILPALSFAKASPTRLLSTETITFPRFKRIIIFLQLGISIFLIVSSLIIRRQVTYSLLKEPGRNHDQVVYVDYPRGLSNEGLKELREGWKKNNANIVGVMATSHLPHRIASKEVDSEFYSISVDPVYKDFFNLSLVEGRWFMANDRDSIFVVNEEGKRILHRSDQNSIGVFKDISGQFNLPGKPTKLNISPYFKYNFLCIRVLEVDIRRTVDYLSRCFGSGSSRASVSFLNKHFEDWLSYQDRLNALSEVLAVVAGLLSCLAIYGLSLSIVRDKLKQIAIRKLWGASSVTIARILIRQFMVQLAWAILVFGPVTYIFVQEILRTFVYRTHFTWSDPAVPLVYCVCVIILLCAFQVFSLNRKDLSASLKGN